MKEEIIEELQRIQAVTGEYNKMKHIFSGDEGVSTLADLNRAVSRVKFLLAAQGLKDVAVSRESLFKKGFGASKKGCLVRVRPVGEAYGGKTYLGFYIGDGPAGASMKLEDGGSKMLIEFSGNPAIFVPDLGEMFFGYECWWCEVESEDDVREITNETIGGQWYVKALRAISENKAEKETAHEGQ
jgi:hypothetical protein